MVYIDGHHETEYGLKQIRGHTNPITQIFSNRFKTIPGKAGAYGYGTELEPKPLTIPLVVVKSSTPEANEKIEEFSSLFVDDLGKPKVVTVIFDYDPHRYYNAKINGEIMPIRVNNNTSELELNLIAEDPYRYSIVQNDEITWGSEVLTFENRIYTLGHVNGSTEFLITANQTIKIDVIGLALQPVIHLEGTATDLVIENEGKRIEVGTFTNAEWTIDTEKYIGYLNGDEKILKMNKFMLRHGVNDIRFSGTNLDLRVSIRFRDRWQ